MAALERSAKRREEVDINKKAQAETRQIIAETTKTIAAEKKAKEEAERRAATEKKEAHKCTGKTQIRRSNLKVQLKRFNLQKESIESELRN